VPITNTELTQESWNDNETLTNSNNLPAEFVTSLRETEYITAPNDTEAIGDRSNKASVTPNARSNTKAKHVMVKNCHTSTATTNGLEPVTITGKLATQLSTAYSGGRAEDSDLLDSSQMHGNRLRSTSPSAAVGLQFIMSLNYSQNINSNGAKFIEDPSPLWATEANESSQLVEASSEKVESDQWETVLTESTTNAMAAFGLYSTNDEPRSMQSTTEQSANPLPAQHQLQLGNNLSRRRGAGVEETGGNEQQSDEATTPRAEENGGSVNKRLRFGDNNQHSMRSSEQRERQHDPDQDDEVRLIVAKTTVLNYSYTFF